MRVAVAGGTGTAGRFVVAALERDGHEAVVLARGAGVDLVSGAGLAEALAGVEAVIDVANAPAAERGAAVDFFSAETDHLLAEGAQAGVRHHVLLSIVGIDRVDQGYYHGKLRQEQLVEAGAVPWTILRATQFHEFAEQTLTFSTGPEAPVPIVRCRPVAAREVADALAALAAGPPRGRVPELAGPREEDLPDMAERLLRATGQDRRVRYVTVPGQVGEALIEGALLPKGEGPRGTQTFDAWLEEKTR